MMREDAATYCEGSGGVWEIALSIVDVVPRKVLKFIPT